MMLLMMLLLQGCHPVMTLLMIMFVVVMQGPGIVIDNDGITNS